MSALYAHAAAARRCISTCSPMNDRTGRWFNIGTALFHCTRRFGVPTVVVRIFGSDVGVSTGVKAESQRHLRLVIIGLRKEYLMPSIRRRNICVAWFALPADCEDRQASRCLYAYLASSTNEILYIGMSWNQTIRAQSSYSAKRKLWDFLNRESGSCDYIPLAGHIDIGPGRQLSKALLFDIESLLIQNIAPRGSVQAISTRTSRPGMIVQCVGGCWPTRRQFVDH